MKRFLLVFLLVLLSVVSTPAFSLNFTVTEIGNYQAIGINNSAQVVVQYSSAQGPRRVGIWQNGSVQELGLTGAIAPEFESQDAKGINNNGQVILRVSNVYQAYIWENDSYTHLGNLPITTGPSFGTEPFDLNDFGQVVGQSWTGQPDGYHAFLWGGSIQDLCGPGAAVAINNVGQVAGNGCGSSESFVYEDGSFTRLGDFRVSEESDINDNGLIAGQAEFDTGGRAAIWSTDGLNILSDAFGEAKAINALDQAVGVFSNGLPGNSAFYWDESHGILDLNDLIDPSLGISLVNAVDINDSGQILADGRVTLGEQTFSRSYLLTPIPIPAAAWLFGSALGLLGWMRIRDRNITVA